MKDQKGCENQVGDHLSHLEPNMIVIGGNEIDDSFPDETLMAISLSQVPWYVDIANYHLCGIVPNGSNHN